mgnify:CR=1 FL=1
MNKKNLWFLTLFSLILVSALTIFYGCDNNIYKNHVLKMQCYHMHYRFYKVALDPNIGDNDFSFSCLLRA